MIQTAAIIATTITAGTFCTLWLDARSKYRWAKEGWQRASDRCDAQAATSFVRAMALAAQVREDVEQQRSDATRRGNLTRSANHRALVSAKAEQIRKEIGR